ncbi:MAG: hypothetical protein ACMXYG_02525 [Candidatus Woesearchaeota archaeon]
MSKNNKKKSSNKKTKNSKKNKKSTIKNIKKDNIKSITTEDILESSAIRIKRLEEIHNERLSTPNEWDKIAYWTFLIVTLFSNIFMSGIIAFLIIFLKFDPLVYVLIGIFGLGFGMIYSFLLHNLKSSFFTQNKYAKIFVVTTGFINTGFIIIVNVMIFNYFGLNYNLSNLIDIAVLYMIFYMIPSFIQMLFNKLRKAL